MQPDALEKRLRSSVARVVSALAEQSPLVLAFDDLHWADLSSIELLESLLPLAETHAICFLNVFRPRYQETSERLRRTAATSFADCYAEVELQPLDDGATRRLIDNFFGGGDVPHARRQRLSNQSRNLRGARNTLGRTDLGGDLRHSVHDAALLVLGERFRSTSAHGQQTLRPVVAHAGEEYSDTARPGLRRDRVEEHVHARTVAVVRLLRPVLRGRGSAAANAEHKAGDRCGEVR